MGKHLIGNEEGSKRMKRENENERSKFCWNCAGRSVNGSKGGGGTDGSGQGATKMEPAHEKGTKTKTTEKAGKASLPYGMEAEEEKEDNDEEEVEQEEGASKQNEFYTN